MSDKICPHVKKLGCPTCGRWLGWIDLQNPSRSVSPKEWDDAKRQIQTNHDSRNTK